MEFLRLALLGAERLDDAVAGERFGTDVRDLRQRLLAAPRGPAHALAKIRDRLGTDLPGWRRAVTAAPFTRRFGTLTQDEPGILLKRLPRGFTDDHPAASWLRYKSFTVGVGYADRDLQSAALVDLAMRDFALMLPMARWLNRALGYLPASTR